MLQSYDIMQRKKSEKKRKKFCGFKKLLYLCSVIGYLKVRNWEVSLLTSLFRFYTFPFFANHKYTKEIYRETGGLKRLN